MFPQDVTRALIAQWGPLVMAELRLETSGQYAGAVRLWVGDDIVASIPHEEPSHSVRLSGKQIPRDLRRPAALQSRTMARG